jgi:hypothetical protein
LSSQLKGLQDHVEAAGEQPHERLRLDTLDLEPLENSGFGNRCQTFALIQSNGNLLEAEAILQMLIEETPAAVQRLTTFPEYEGDEGAQGLLQVGAGDIFEINRLLDMPSLVVQEEALDVSAIVYRYVGHDINGRVLVEEDPLFNVDRAQRRGRPDVRPIIHYPPSGTFVGHFAALVRVRINLKSILFVVYFFIAL